MAMQLTSGQQELLDGKQGEALAKVMKTLVMYGDTFGAKRMVPVTSEYGHLVTSFGLGVLTPVYDLLDQLIDAGVKSAQPFSVDPRPLQKKVPANAAQKLFFKVMYSKQKEYEERLRKLGIMDPDAFSCTCYMQEMGNTPKMGDILSWAESSAVVYANSVLGARCNRNSGILDIFGSIAECVPEFGLLTDEGRKATWIVEIKTSHKPEAQVLGSAIGMKVMEDVPYIKGLSRFIGTALNEDAKAYLKDMGAATASNGAVGLYHVDGLTPEAAEQGEALIAEGAKTYVIDDAELERVIDSYPCIWKDKDATPKLCFIGCPHLSMTQLEDWTENIEAALKEAKRSKVAVPTVVTAAPAVMKVFAQSPHAARLEKMGVVTSSICPLMYMNNPLCGKMPVITNSNKLRTYTSARYGTDAQILSLISKGGKVQ